MEHKSQQRRVFTRAEDEMIVAHARGDVSFKLLMRTTRSSRETLHRRAGELGVQIRATRSHHRRPKKDDGNTVIHEPYECGVGEDKLLARLHLHHPERAR